jgi:hypothetical protein
MVPVLFAIGQVCVLFAHSSCSSLQAGVYLSSIDKNNGDRFVEEEITVREYLNKILENTGDYAISAYERCGVSYQIRRTRLVTHSYYVITKISTGEFHTLSFYGTKIAFYSEGAWAMDADSDMTSFVNFSGGNNDWDVIEMYSKNDIDVKETVRNIIKKN